MLTDVWLNLSQSSSVTTFVCDCDTYSCFTFVKTGSLLVHLTYILKKGFIAFAPVSAALNGFC